MWSPSAWIVSLFRVTLALALIYAAAFIKTDSARLAVALASSRRVHVDQKNANGCPTP